MNELLLRRRVAVSKETDWSEKYVTFEAIEAGTFTLTIPANVGTSLLTSVSYSLDNGATWVTTPNSSSAVIITTPEVSAGSIVLWKGEGKSYGQSASSGSTFSATCLHNVRGNAMSLLYGDSFKNNTTLKNNYTLLRLFKGNTKLIDAGDFILPSKTLINSCYREMFMNCTALTTAPELPATSNIPYSYYSMFNGCSALVNAPSEIKSTSVGSAGCQSMFERCTSLVKTPKCVFTSVVGSSCQNMFLNCTSLQEAPIELLATTLGGSCYYSMFEGCSKLEMKPYLPATNLVSACYARMFKNCKKINHITCLATTISSNNATATWLTGVSATGTFVKAASMTGWNSGTSGIPSGWTVEDYAE